MIDQLSDAVDDVIITFLFFRRNAQATKDFVRGLGGQYNAFDLGAAEINPPE
jgi:hypothetical protein